MTRVDDGTRGFVARGFTCRPDDIVRATMIELGVLTLMIVAFVASLLMLRNRHPGAIASRG